MKTASNRTLFLGLIILLILVFFYGLPFLQNVVGVSESDILREKERYQENIALINHMADDSELYRRYARQIDRYLSLDREEKTAELIRTLERYIRDAGAEMVDLKPIKPAGEKSQTSTVEIELIATMMELVTLLHNVDSSDQLIRVSEMVVLKEQMAAEKLVIRATFEWIGN